VFQEINNNRNHNNYNKKETAIHKHLYLCRYVLTLQVSSITTIAQLQLQHVSIGI